MDGSNSTIPSTGSFRRLGMHSVVENSCYSPSGSPYLVFIPRTQEMYESCTSDLPYYDVELHAKVMRPSEPNSGTASVNSVFGKLQKDHDAEAATISKTIPSMQIIFAMKSIEEFMFLVLEVVTQTWTLGYTSASGVTILNQLVDHEIRLNQFYNILIQLRGPHLSVDINNVPVFTSVRPPPELEGSAVILVSSRVGALDSALKEWKLRSILPPGKLT